MIHILDVALLTVKIKKKHANMLLSFRGIASALAILKTEIRVS